MKKNLILKASMLLLALGTLCASAAGTPSSSWNAPSQAAINPGAKALNGKPVFFNPVMVSKGQVANPWNAAAQTLPMSKAGSLRMAPQRMAAAPSIQGYVIFNNYWAEAGYDEFGYYDIPLNGNLMNCFLPSDYSLNGGGCVVGNNLYGTLYFDGGSSVYFLKYDLTTGEMTARNASIGSIALDMAADPTTGDIYGCFYTDDASGFCLGKIDPNTGARTNILTLDDGMAWNACAIDSNGQMYAISTEGKLYRVDKESGSMRFIGNTGVAPKYLSSGCIDPNTGEFYWSVNNDSGAFLYKVDKTNAKATLVREFDNGEEIVALNVPTINCDVNAPDMPTDLEAIFTDGNLSGHVDFKLPTTLANGTPATGNCSYALYVNGQLLATDEASYGESVSVDYTAPEAGTYVFTVTASNTIGTGPANKEIAWIGNDVPKIVRNVVLTNNGYTMNLSWSAPEGSLHGGYYEPSDVTYDIVRMPDAVKVATGVASTSYSETVPEPESRTTYSYAVYPVFHEQMGLGVTSNGIPMGKVAPPFVETFDSEASLEGWTFLDGNHDGVNWQYNANYGYFYDQYSTSLPKDEYIITPGLTLQGNAYYEFSFDTAINYAEYPEKVEVVWGTAPTAEALTNVAMAPITLADPGNWYTHKCGIMVPEDGVYYIAVHAVSDPDMYVVFVDNIGISAPIAGEMPSLPTELTATGDLEGSMDVTIKCKAPSRNLNGDLMTEELSMIIFREGEMVGFDVAMPGEEFTYVDTVPQGGYYTYEVAASNEAGIGPKASVMVFAGVNIPAAPTNVDVRETVEGTVEITWDPVTTDRDGNPINPEYVYYNVIGFDANGQQVLISIGDTETTCEYEEMAPGQPQRFVYYGVSSNTDTGTLGYVLTKTIPVGKAFTLPYKESCPDAKIEHDYMMEVNGVRGQWGMASEKTFAGAINSQDNDGGMIYMQGGAGASTSLITGKISLDVDYPQLSYYYAPLGEDDENTVDIIVRYNGENHLIQTDTHCVPAGVTFEQGMWVPVTVDLGEFQGKEVQVVIKPTVVTHTFIIMDNIRIEERYAKDLKVSGLRLPAKVYGGEEFFMTFTLENLGVETANAADYRIDIYHNGEPETTATTVTLGYGEKKEYKVPYTLGLDQESGEHDFAIVVDYEGDRDEDNNLDGPVVVIVDIPNLPAIEGFGYTLEENGDVVLTWDEPEALTDNTEPRTDDFEDAEHLRADGFGEWTIIDRDGNASGTFGDVTLGIEDKPMGFFPINSSMIPEESRDAFEAHSGDTFIAALWSPDGGCDDWMISPALTGEAQTVSLWARSFDGGYAESFEILYSTTDTELTSFRKAAVFANISGEWNEYSAKLPEGTRFFAIHCISPDSYMLMIDDITYIPSTNGGGSIELLGYNVYHNGELLNADGPLTEPTYTHSTGNVGLHEYYVTAVYDRGETAPSEVINLTLATPAGDANGDYAIDATDIGYLIDKMLGFEDSEFIFENADMNGDNKIDATDIGLIIRLILGF